MKFTNIRQLKPCPFCGTPDPDYLPPTCKKDDPYDPLDRLYPSLRCTGCGCEVFGDNEDFSGVSAARRWEARA